jgi:hypothetical protein
MNHFCLASTCYLSSFSDFSILSAFSTYLMDYLWNSHFRRTSVSFVRYFMLLQLSTININLLLWISIQLDRHGPAVSVIPVLTPTYSSGFSCSNWCVFYLNHVKVTTLWFYWEYPFGCSCCFLLIIRQKFNLWVPDPSSLIFRGRLLYLCWGCFYFLAFFCCLCDWILCFLDCWFGLFIFGFMIRKIWSRLFLWTVYYS